MKTKLQPASKYTSPADPNQKTAILVFAGHSGGHLFPAIAFAEAYKERRADSLILITSEKGRPFLENQKLPFETVHYLTPFPFSFSKFYAFGKNLIRGGVDSLRWIRKYRPAAAVGFGSYASFPGVVFSRLLQIPTLIHEQNFEWGKATRHLAFWADAVATSFDAPRDAEKKVVHSGLPLRKELLNQGRSVHDFQTDRFRILVLGGSQGAHRLNELLIQAFSSFQDEEKKKLAVNHITGHQDSDWIRGEYERLGIAAQIFSFTHEIGTLYREADMAITRAGANTLFELAFFGIPAIVIPYPHASSHQTANAEYFLDRGAVISREEKKLDPGWLSEQIRLLWLDAGKRRQMSEAITRISAPGAAENLAGLVESFIGEKG